MMSLKDRLKKYLESNPGFHAKGKLCDLARQSELKATGEHTGRRLRELHEEGEIEVKYEKGHAYYKAKVDEMAWFNSLPG